MGRARLGGFFAVAGVALAVGGAAALVVALVAFDEFGDDTPGLGLVITGGVLLMIGVIWAAVGFGLRAWYRSLAGRAAQEAELFRTGERATGVIEQVEATAVEINDNPQIVLRVRIKPRHGEEFVHERRLVVPAGAVPVPGHLIDVAFDPADRSRVALAVDERFVAPPARMLVTRPPGAEAAGAAPTPAPASAPPAGDLLRLLEELGRLREEGALTEEEFLAQKARLLGGRPSGP